MIELWKALIKVKLYLDKKNRVSLLMHGEIIQLIQLWMSTIYIHSLIVTIHNSYL